MREEKGGGAMDDLNETIARIERPHAVDLIRTRIRFATVTLVCRKNGFVVGEGTAFVVSVAPPQQAGGQSDYIVVTARHVVQGPLIAGASTVLSIPLEPDLGRNPDPRVFETADVPVDSWRHGEGDVSVAPLPVDALPRSHFLTAIPRGAFLDRMLLPFASDVDLYGRVLAGDNSIVVTRHGSLVTTERPTVKLHIEPQTVTPSVVYVVEGSATPGMSGGPAVLTTGVGTMQNAVLGLVHGYAYDERTFARQFENDDLETLRQEYLRELRATRNRLVYVVPHDEIGRMVDAMARH